MTKNIYLRWAAKEAVIKAHRHRRIRLKDVSILPALSLKPSDQLESEQNLKVHAIVHPVSKTISMSRQIAKARGLFALLESGLEPGTKLRILAKFRKMDLDDSNTLIERSKRIRQEDSQIAELSISHDGNYATAVCIALDEDTTGAVDTEPITDGGLGEPIHEPEWGDRGWLSEA